MEDLVGNLMKRMTKRAKLRVGSVFYIRYFAISMVITVVTIALAGCQPPVRSTTQPSPVPGASQAPKEGVPASPTARQVEAGYRIGPEDVLAISVWKEPELQREEIVRPDGGISFPLAGSVQAAGRTVQEVEAEITRKIRRYIPDAVVTVSVKQISGYTIFVIGRVNNPGQFTLGRYVDVVQALTLAGGFTPFASEDDINILRRDGGKEIRIPFDYSDVKKGKRLEQNIILRSGDVVVVP